MQSARYSPGSTKKHWFRLSIGCIANRLIQRVRQLGQTDGHTFKKGYKAIVCS
jgi:hypothetical protein